MLKRFCSAVERHFRLIFAALVIGALFTATRLTNHSTETAPASVIKRFKFSRQSLPEVRGPEVHHSREYLHPNLRRISAFVSSIGASVALNDLDGDGLPNDLCYIDTRTDQVIIAPVPGTGQRYEPFALRQDGFFDRGHMAPLSCGVSDFNEDGSMDLLVLYAGRTPVLYLRRPGVPISAAAYVGQKLVSQDQVWVTIAMTMADFDGDGHVDLMIGNYFKDGSDIYNPDGTGIIELPLGQPRAFNGGGERVFRWVSATQGDSPSVTFEEVPKALPSELPKQWPLAMAAYDLTGDLLPEVYIAHDFGPDRLLRNISTPGHIRFALVEKKRSFFTPMSKTLGHDSFKSMGVDFGDINNDGLPDIYVSNVTSPLGDLESQYAFINTGDRDAIARGDAPFVDKSEDYGVARTGWSWEARLGDFDNDGVLELLQAVGFIPGKRNRWAELQELAMSNDSISHLTDYSWPNLLPGDDVSGHEQNPFFVRVGDRYVNIAKQIGFGESSVSRAIATADVDGDGDLDMAVANMWAPSTFYRNECPQCGHFLGLHLLLPLSEGKDSVEVKPGHPQRGLLGRPAVGASVQIRRADGQVLIGQVDGGSGHTGKRSPDLLFGLGQQEGPSEVSLKWRDQRGGIHSTTLKLPPGWFTIVLGSKAEEEKST